jgi:hypothetical protein
MITSPKRLGPERDYAGEVMSIYKKQTRPLVREGVTQKQDRLCQREIITVFCLEPQMGLDTKTY